MVYESLVARFVTPVIKRHMATGRTQGEQRQNALWHAWLQRKREAKAQGMDFNEQPPGSHQPSNNKPNP